MNKTKKNETFILLKIVFPVREYQKESLKQSMKNEKLCVFVRNSLLLECILSIFDSRLYPCISLYFPLYPSLLE